MRRWWTTETVSATTLAAHVPVTAIPMATVIKLAEPSVRGLVVFSALVRLPFTIGQNDQMSQRIVHVRIKSISEHLSTNRARAARKR